MLGVGENRSVLAQCLGRLGFFYVELPALHTIDSQCAAFSFNAAFSIFNI
ncbi:MULTISPECIES: hypothetical protein [Vibrio]|nr:hypothetical protein [Vibrio splendidus]